MDINDCISTIKHEIELGIITTTDHVTGKKYDNGSKAKEGIIRSSRLIRYLHEVVKYDLIKHGIDSEIIYPPLGQSNPEIKLAGFLKQKDQDVTVLPKNTTKTKTKITWGPLAHENVYDEYGKEFTEKCLVVNVRSQLSSLAKNSDTLFERTFAEAMNLHTIYDNIVLGDIYLIPVFEYDESYAKNNEVVFSTRKTNLEKYISFFSSISGRKNVSDDGYKYERCALLIVDFSNNTPVLYTTTQQLKDERLVDKDFDLELEDISFTHFADDLIARYKERFDESNIS